MIREYVLFFGDAEGERHDGTREANRALGIRTVPCCHVDAIARRAFGFRQVGDGDEDQVGQLVGEFWGHGGGLDGQGLVEQGAHLVECGVRAVLEINMRIEADAGTKRFGQQIVGFLQLGTAIFDTKPQHCGCFI